MEPANQGEAGKDVAKLSQVIQIDEAKIHAQLGEWFAARWKRR